jgi:dipeptidyl-peptidase-4
MARWPEPGWQVPRAIAFSPDAELVTYLQSEGGNDEMALFAFDIRSKQSRVLLRASDLEGAATPLSREEELRRERQRQRSQGITAYLWAERAPLLIVPHGGDVYAKLGEAPIVRLTHTAAPELDPKPCATGERIVFARGTELFSLDLESRRETALTRGAPEGVTRGQSDFNGQEEFDEPSGFFWSPRCDRIAYLEVDERKVEELPVAGYRDGKADVMMQRYPRAGKTNPKVSLFVIDVTTRKTVPIVPYADGGAEHYFGRFRFSADGRKLVFQALTRDQKQRELLSADTLTGETRSVAHESSPTWVEFSDAQLLEKSSEVVWLRDFGGYRHLELLDLSGKAQPRQLTQGAWDVTRLNGLDEASRRVFFTATRESPLERRLYSAVLDAAGEPQLYSAEKGTHSLTLERTARRGVDLHSSLSEPPRVDVFELAGTKLGELPVPRDNDFATLGLRPAETVQLQSASGEKLYGHLLKPNRIQPGKRYPVVIMVYGGPTLQMVQDRFMARLAWQHLADRGVVVFQLDNRGTPGRGRAFETAIQGKFGQTELEDQLVGLDYLASLPYVDKKRIGIYGHSYGGYLTLMALLKAPSRFRVGVAGSPGSDWTLYDSGYTERYLGTPEVNPAVYQAASPFPLIPNLTAKLLIVHSLMDENVHFSGTAKLLDAFTAANKPVDLLLFPGERHGYRDPAVKRYSWGRIMEYLTAHL